jgi:prefoldin subunit 5
VNADRTSRIALLLSAITLAIVLFIAVRPTAAQPDAAALTAIGNLRAENGILRAEIGSLRAEIGTLRGDIAALRTIVTAALREDSRDDILARLDRLETAVAGIQSTLDRICSAIQSSPFAPSGFSC